MKTTASAIIAAIAIATSATPAAAADLGPSAHAFRAAHEAAIVGELDALTRMRSVAADPAGLTATASWLQTELEQRGLKTRLLSASDGDAPVVYGELASPGARRTVVFYAHYDGQPVTPSEWSSDPFVPVMRSGAAEVDWRKAAGPFDPEWRLYGRAASDDKATIVAVLAALDALKAAGRRPSVNVKIFWEGEEERGSPHLEAVLKANAALLKADLWLIGDAPVHQSRRMQLYFGARGTSGVEMTVYGPLHPLHDGHYGNWVPNPAVMAAELVAGMRDSDGRILIPHFSDGVRPLTPAEQAAIAALPRMEDELRHQFGIGRSEGGEGLVDSLMRPALNVRGLRAGQVGEQAANAIPADASISIDFRTVPGQTPEGVRSAVEAWLRAKDWTLIEAEPDAAQRAANARLIRLRWEGGYPAERTSVELPASRAMIAAASRAAGRPVLVLPMMGASVPMYLFADELKTPVVGVPIVNHDNNQHAANENLRLQNLWDGVELYAELIGGLDW